jgi:methylated-DNA-[protein]-cysteine S-methyltransferase
LPDGRSLDLDDELDAEQIDLLNRVVDCANGKADTFADVSISLDHLGPFARKVVQRCRRIPAGQTMTYAQLAAASGSAKAARAVGNVMASNRFPLIVPCHRVVGSGGGLGGFSAPQGIELKKQLLRSEGVQI